MAGRHFHKNSGSDIVSGGPKGKPTSIILNATATKGGVSTSIILVQTRLSLPIRKFETLRLSLPLFNLVALDDAWVMDSRNGSSEDCRLRVGYMLAVKVVLDILYYGV